MVRQERVRLDVEREVLRRALDPQHRVLLARREVVRRVDLDDRELLGVVAEPSFRRLRFGRIEVPVLDERRIGPARGADQDASHGVTLGELGGSPRRSLLLPGDLVLGLTRLALREVHRALRPDVLGGEDREPRDDHDDAGTRKDQHDEPGEHDRTAGDRDPDPLAVALDEAPDGAQRVPDPLRRVRHAHSDTSFGVSVRSRSALPEPRVARRESAIESPIANAMNASDSQTGMCQTSVRSIFAPTNTRTAASPSFRNTNRSIIPASMKYSARSPRIANAFDVNTRNGSFVTAKIAGIESTAKRMSLVSIRTRTARSGVAIRRPASRTVRFCPWYSSVVGTTRLNSRSAGLRSGWIASSRERAIRTPVNRRNAPKT